MLDQSTDLRSRWIADLIKYSKGESDNELTLSKEEAPSVLTELLLNQRGDLNQLRSTELALCLWELCANTRTGIFFALKQGVMDLDTRCACVEAVGKLFSEYFAPRCSSTWENESDTTMDSAKPKLEWVCVTWWDELTYLYSAGDEPDFNRKVLSVLSDLLLMPNLVCVESGLHGFNHWIQMFKWNREDQFTKEAQDRIDSFLTNQKSLPANLVNYARLCREGRAQ